MVKKYRLLILIFGFILQMSACGEAGAGGAAPEALPAGGVMLDVVTTFAGNDNNARAFQQYSKQWEQETGNHIADLSAISDDNFKARVKRDFETSSEPDVLFFFTGADANGFIEADKVVSLEEIRAEYPEYGENMDEKRIPVSLVDGQAYAVPVNGFWEALYVNTEVLEAAGVAVPGSNYTWEQFLNDCEVIKEAGYLPIAAALGHIPHYWWEYTIYNHNSPQTHVKIPENLRGKQGQAWLEGMEDLTALYQAGYFPENTLAVTDDETFLLFMEGKAAFLLDGSWKVGSIITGCQTDYQDPSTLDEAALDKFDVTFVPAQGERRASDLIGGMSMGYYISRKAWNDPEKREAAVRFVEYMTRDEVVHDFAKHTAMALKEDRGEAAGQEYTSLQLKALSMLSKATSFTDAVQDIFQGECRTIIFDELPEIVTGNSDAAEVIQTGLDIYARRKEAADTALP